MREIIVKLYKFKIFKRIIPSIIKIICKFLIKPYVIIDHNNFKLKLNLNNPIDREIFLKKKYEEKNIFFLQQLLEKNSTDYFFDIGAHMGFYTTSMASIFPNLLIASFEPIKNNYNQLESNIKLNNLESKVKIYNKILSNESKKLKMWTPLKNKTGGFAVYDENDSEIKKYNLNKILYEFAYSEKLDDIYKLINKKLAFKIDAERHEKFIIMGSRELLTKNKVILQIEIFEQLKEEIGSMLKKMNFHFIKSNGKDYFYCNYKIIK
jgi:FkbM family methyltransferase